MEDNQCPCGRLFLNRDDLNSHISAEHKPNHWNCSKCDKIYESRGVLYKYFRDKHQGLFQYNCQSCDHGNDDRACFAYHMYKKHGGVEIEGIAKCPNAGCKYVAPQKCILVTHLETCVEGQAEQKKHICDQCEKGYRSLLSESLSSLLSSASFIFVGLHFCVGLLLLNVGGTLVSCFFGREQKIFRV